MLAAGLGTRLRPITDSVPKCLVPILGRPLLDYWLDLLLEGGIERVLVNSHYLADQVRTHVAGSPWSDRVDLAHEEVLLGTGGTVVYNADYVGQGSFLVAHADNLTRFDVRRFVERHDSRARRIAITMMTFETDAPQTCGIVEEDADGIVHAFHEKVRRPPSSIANGAVYIFDHRVVQFMRGLGSSTIDLSTEVLPHFLGRIQTFHNDDYLRDIGSPSALKRAEQEYATLMHAAV